MSGKKERNEGAHGLGRWALRESIEGRGDQAVAVARELPERDFLAGREATFAFSSWIFS